MGTEVESTRSEAPGQNEGPNQEASGEVNPERKRCPAKGGAKSALKRYAADFYAKLERALAEQRNEVFAPAAGAVEDGGRGRPTTPIFTPPATRNGPKKKGNPEAAD